MDPLRPLISTPSAIPDYPQTYTSSSVRHNTLTPLGDQRTSQLVLEGDSQHLRTPYPTAIGEETGSRNNVYIDRNRGEEKGGNRCARKRRCHGGRANGYTTGCEMEDTATRFSDGKHLHENFGLQARVMADPSRNGQISRSRLRSHRQRSLGG